MASARSGLSFSVRHLKHTCGFGYELCPVAISAYARLKCLAEMLLHMDYTGRTWLARMGLLLLIFYF